MHIQQAELLLRPFPKGLHLITPLIENTFSQLPSIGMMNLFIHHTSAGLTINENADPSARMDLEEALWRLAPENHPQYKHTHEGSDDMPAHILSSWMGCSLSIPITNHLLALGTWQGIYLCEFRNNGGRRKITLTVFGNPL